MTASFAALLAIGMLGVLFAVANGVERRAATLQAYPRLRRGVYTLALGVYCSSWTFYGAVGSAVSDGWNYLPIYLAPVALLLLAPGFLRRLAEAVQQERASTISDFIAARFGHDLGVARIITIIALCGTVPYIALQLRSMGTAVSIIASRDLTIPVMIGAAGLLALFAIMFGARRYEIAGRNEGLVFSVALESLVKLVALGLVGAFAVSVVAGASATSLSRASQVLASQFAPAHVTLETFVIALISAFAVIVLPRQFYMGLAEAHSSDDLPRARWGLSFYLICMALLIMPIALGGLVALPSAASPDSFVLLLPAAKGASAIAIAALLGGLSSGAAMVIVDATALATMVSNDLIFPALLRSESGRASGDLGRRMLAVRRAAIVGVVGLALLWALLVDPARSLASIGLVAFAAMAQFVPHLLLAVAAPGRDPLAARASLLTGLCLWLYTLALPPIMQPEWLVALQGTIIDPLRLLGIGHSSPLVHGVFWSLSANIAVLALTTAGHGQSPRIPRLIGAKRPIGNLGDLSTLVARFVGSDRASQEFPVDTHAQPVDSASARLARELIASVVGNSSARALVASALAGGRMSLEDVKRLLDESGQSLRFSRQLLAATFENLQSGVSVIDSDLNLVAWNSRYVDLFGYPSGMVRVGVPIADLIRFNVERGNFGGTPDEEVEKRLYYLRLRKAYQSERVKADGQVIKSVGGPMPGGGYLTSFTDITDDAAVREELERTLDQLEQRVADRTQELREANRRLADAGRDKTRFLAAASHDLLQPLHAARLFNSALDRQLEGPAKALSARVDRSIVGAEELLRALLDISKLDAGGIQPNPEPVALDSLVLDIAENMRPQATEKGLFLRTGPLTGVVETDPGLLRSILQNLVANAVRYTVNGGVLIGVRRRGSFLRIDVCDTGVGIPVDRQRDVFGEFTRLGQVEAEGLGLGLAIVERIARLLGARIELSSQEGRGSRFSVLLPAMLDDANLACNSVTAPSAVIGTIPESPRALRVLVVDNEPDIVAATIALIEALGHKGVGAADIAGALDRVGEADVLLADYQLDHDEDGLRLIDLARSRNPGLSVALVTAENDIALRNRLRLGRIALFVKPADPAAIGSFLTAASHRHIKPQ
jgi:signal transduction histidine kinase/Na+/proline symporter